MKVIISNQGRWCNNCVKFNIHRGYQCYTKIKDKERVHFCVPCGEKIISEVNMSNTKTATKTKREPNQKVLREDLQLRKKEYEKLGWVFTYNDNGWSAKNGDLITGLFSKFESLIESTGFALLVDQLKTSNYFNTEKKKRDKSEVTKKIGKEQADVYSWLYGTPSSDVNFQINLKKAEAGTIEMVLADLPETYNKSRISALSARLRKLKGSDSASSPEQAKIAPIKNTRKIKSSNSVKNLELPEDFLDDKTTESDPFSEYRERISALEAKGWKFNLTPNERNHISGQKHFKYENKPTFFYHNPDQIERLLICL